MWDLKFIFAVYSPSIGKPISNLCEYLANYRTGLVLIQIELTGLIFSCLFRIWSESVLVNAQHMKMSNLKLVYDRNLYVKTLNFKKGQSLATKLVVA